jgi:hypothetical protein
MMNLAQSLRNELNHWRFLCAKIPPLEALPEFPLNDEVGPKLNEYGIEIDNTAAMEEFNVVVSTRTKQIDHTVTICIDSFNRMESCLARGGNSASFNLGKKCIATVASLE